MSVDVRQAMGLMDGLLKFSPKARSTMAQVRASEWFQSEPPSGAAAASSPAGGVCSGAVVDVDAPRYRSMSTDDVVFFPPPGKLRRQTAHTDLLCPHTCPHGGGSLAGA
jgi:hypothetical protein